MTDGEDFWRGANGKFAAVLAELLLAAACAISPFVRMYKSCVTLSGDAFSVADVVKTLRRLIEFGGEIGRGADFSDIDVISMDSENRGLVAVPVIIFILYLIAFVLLALAVGALLLDKSGDHVRFWHCARGSARSFLLAAAAMLGAVTAIEIYAEGSAELNDTAEPTLLLFAALWAAAEVIADIRLHKIKLSNRDKQKELTENVGNSKGKSA